MVELYLIEHADGPSFPSIVASGPNASVPHAVPSDRRIQAGELLKIDIGARASGYCSDMTRTVCFGEPTRPARSPRSTPSSSRPRSTPRRTCAQA